MLGRGGASTALREREVSWCVLERAPLSSLVTAASASRRSYPPSEHSSLLGKEAACWLTLPSPSEALPTLIQLPSAVLVTLSSPAPQTPPSSGKQEASLLSSLVSALKASAMLREHTGGAWSARKRSAFMTAE